MAKLSDVYGITKDRPKVKVVAEATGGKVPPKPPVVAPASGEGPKFIPVTISLDQTMIDRLDDKAHAMRLTRSAAIRKLLEGALK